MHEAITAVLNGRSVADLVLLLLPLAVTPFVSLWQRFRLSKPALEPPRRSRVYRRFLVQQWLLVLCIAVLWWGNARPFAELGLDWPLSPLAKAGLAAAAAMALLLFAYRLISLLRLDAGRRAKLTARLTLMRIAPRTYGEAVLFVPVALTAGISEELLYRGFLIWFFAPAAGPAAAVAISTLLFGLAHIYQGWKSVLATTSLGLALGILYVASGSLWWVMGLHAAVDLQFCIIGFFLAAWSRGTVPAGG